MLATRKTFLLFALVASVSSSAFAQGVFLTGVGAINRSMGGAATAAPIDAMGALHWNPATISGLRCNEVAFSAEIMLLDEEMTVNGITARDESGVAPIPSIGWVHHLEGTDDTIGLGLYSFAGFAQNMPSVVGHPVLDPSLTPIAGSFVPSLGPLYSEAQFFQIVPTFSRAITDRVSVGIAPTINLGRIELDPIPVPGAYGSPGAGTRWSWGLGAQAGVYYMHSDTLNFGLSIKSPQWFEDFRTLTVVGGVPTVNKLKFDLPMIVSGGMSYTGIEDWLFALDMRYFDWKNTDGFSDLLQWSNVFSVAAGAQRRVNDKLYLRGGYTFNTSPINSGTIGANFASPLIQQHVLGVGASYNFAKNVDLTMSYNQVLAADKTGPAFPFAGDISSQVATYSLAAAVTVRYGSD